MRRVNIFCLLFGAALALSSTVLQAQSPIPIVQAATPAPVVATTSVEPTSVQAKAALLQEIKATNEDILKRQKAALEQLGELQKAADQLKAYSKRG